MAKLPRLDDLIWFPDLAGDDRNWIFEGDSGDGCRQKHCDEIKRRLLSSVRSFGWEMTSTGNGQMRAWRMGDHQIPSVTYYVANVAAVMRAGGIGRKQVAAHRIMAEAQERIPHGAGVFAGD
jgi:hypothetical protein